MSHALKMIVGCVLPLLLIFVLPLFGISGGVSLFIFIVLMFACHLMMVRGHEEHGSGSETEEHHESP
ncbi:MAG: hypothetical protein R6X33_05950 [Candidatus Brocadiia bacterium]